jgi:hypothetical protein
LVDDHVIPGDQVLERSAALLAIEAGPLQHVGDKELRDVENLNPSANSFSFGECFGEGGTSTVGNDQRTQAPVQVVVTFFDYRIPWSGRDVDHAIADLEIP